MSFLRLLYTAQMLVRRFVHCFKSSSLRIFSAFSTSEKGSKTFNSTIGCRPKLRGATNATKSAPGLNILEYRKGWKPACSKHVVTNWAWTLSVHPNTLAMPSWISYSAKCASHRKILSVPPPQFLQNGLEHMTQTPAASTELCVEQRSWFEKSAPQLLQNMSSWVTDWPHRSQDKSDCRDWTISQTFRYEETYPPNRLTR